MFLVSCSHFHKVKTTDKKNIIEVQFNDVNHFPKIGQSVKVYNPRLNTPKFFKSKEPKGWVKENWVQGKIVEVLSNEVIKIELEDDFQISESTLVEY
jgi:hypothetical protein